MLVTDSLVSDAYSLSGRLFGYKGQYYDPGQYKPLLEYCGFDGINALTSSSRNSIIHVYTTKKADLASDLRNR